MSTSRKNSRRIDLIAERFRHEQHMLEMLTNKKISARIGLTSTNVHFLKSLISVFCKLTYAKDDLGFFEGQTPHATIRNAVIENETGLSRRQVQRHMEALEKAGVISMEIETGNRRYVDFSGLPEKAIEWSGWAEELDAERKLLREIMRAIATLKHRASVIVQNTNPTEESANIINQLRELVSTAADDLQAKKKLKISLEHAIDAWQEFEKQQQAVDKNFVVASEMTPPHDIETTPYETTTQSPSQDFVMKKGVPAQFDASHRAGTGQYKANKNEGALYSGCPVDMPTAWKMILQLAPALAPYQRHHRDPIMQVQAAAKALVPVADTVVNTAIEIHGAINVMAAFALAVSHDAYHTDFGDDPRRARAAYARGILVKMPATSTAPRNQTFNPWPSVFGRLKARPSSSRPTA